MQDKKAIVPVERIESNILLIRGQKVMLDSDLAEPYGVETRVLIQAVKRNIERFPEDFMFQLTKEEFEILRCHFGTSSWGGRRYLPYAFTEQKENHRISSKTEEMIKRIIPQRRREETIKVK
jgi:hypothetical protein